MSGIRRRKWYCNEVINDASGVVLIFSLIQLALRMKQLTRNNVIAAKQIVTCHVTRVKLYISLLAFRATTVSDNRKSMNRHLVALFTR